MRPEKSDGQSPKPGGTQAAPAKPARPHATPEPRVAGKGYGPIGIAAVAAAVLYQNTTLQVAETSGAAAIRR